MNRPATSSRSLLLYTNYQSPQTITNWIVDTDSGEKWEVGKGLASGGWSPLGNRLFYYTLLPLPTEIWVSDSDGSNLRQVFDSRNYPSLEITGFDWLSEEVILVNVVNQSENSGFVYILNVNSLSFKKLDAGNFLRISPNGKYWLHYTTQYYFVDLHKNKTPVTLAFTSDFYAFSPNGNQWVYFCNRKESSSSLCLADVSIDGVANEHKIADVETPVVTLDIWWS